METYIVRVYRNNPCEKPGVAGLIEKVETEQKTAFQDMNGLQSILKAFIEVENVDADEKARMDRSASLDISMSA